MSVEFVEPDPTPSDPSPGDPSAPAGTAGRGSAVPGRLLAGVSALAAVLVAVACRVTLYDVVRTASVIDFDGTTTVTTRVPYDAFGHTPTVPLVPDAGTVAFQPGADAYGSTLSISLSDGVAYGPWWLGVTAALVVVAVWSLVRPRSGRPGPVVATLGAALLASVGTAWLQTRSTTELSVPQIRFAAEPGAGLWLLVAAGTMALGCGLFRSVALSAPRPRWRRAARPAGSDAPARRWSGPRR